MHCSSEDLKRFAAFFRKKMCPMIFCQKSNSGHSDGLCKGIMWTETTCFNDGLDKIQSVQIVDPTKSLGKNQ